MKRFVMGDNYHLLKRKTSYYVAIPNESGRGYRLMKSLKTLNKTLARKRALQVLADKSLMASKDDLRTFLLDFWTPGKSKYLRSCVAEGRNLSPVYCQNNRAWIESYFLPYCKDHGILTLDKLDRRTLYDWRDWLFENREKLTVNGEKRKISPSTINKIRQAIHVALEWAVDMELLPANPMARVKRVKESPQTRAILQRDQLVKLFAKPWSDYRAYVASMFAVTTGARLGEVRGLQPAALHLDQGYVDIVTNWQDHQGLKPPKWHSARYGVPLPVKTIEALAQLQTMNPYKSDGQFVFWGATPNEPVTTQRVTRAFKSALEAAKVPTTGVTFHSLRHTYVSLLRHEVGADRVRLAVGHTNTVTTDSYTHETDEGREALRQAVGGLLE